jgi:(p)ppGpp synthase/HD superfamily hydrolase
MMSKEAKKEVERVNLLMDPSLRAAIKRWRHQQEIDTEGEAIRRLLTQALGNNGQSIAA